MAELVPIPDFYGYFVTTEGKVFCNLGKGCRRDLPNHKTVEPYELKYRLNKQGYARVYMRRESTNKREDIYVHRLVAEMFIPNPENKQYVNHLDCIRDHDDVSNLVWSTAAENTSQTEMLGHIIRDEKGRFVSNFDYEKIRKGA